MSQVNLGSNASAGMFNDLSAIGGNAAALSCQIEGKLSEVTGLTLSLQALIAQLEAIQDPPAPGQGASKADLDAWKAKCDQNKAARELLRENIQEVSQKLQKAANDLSSLQARMPEAQATDARKIREAMEQAQKTMESASRSTSSSSAETVSADVSEVRQEIVKQAQKRSIGQVPSGSGGGVPPIGVP